ncbi:MAG: hypothetical protein AB8H79_02640 [Myxococcota bacterium]
MTDLDSTLSRALERLRDPEHPALVQLAELVVTQTTSTPIAELASPRWLASQLTTALEAATRGDTLRTAVQTRLDKGKQAWADDQRPLREVVPDEVVPPLKSLLGRPWTPSERLATRIVRQPAVKDLVGEILEDAVRSFGRRMRSVDDGVLAGLGGRAAKRGRAFGKGLLAAAGVADAASGLAKTMSEEFEAALETRVKGFVGEATSLALSQIVGRMSSEDTAETFAEFRVALLDELLDTPIHELVDEADGMGPLDAVDVVREAIRAQLDSEGFADRAESRIERALQEAGDGTLAAWLDEIELKEVWVESTTEFVGQRLRAAVQTPEFDQWWSALFSD